MAGQRILFITREIVPFFYGGIGTQFQAMAQILIQAGHEIIFLTSPRESFDVNIFEKHYPGCRVFFVDSTADGPAIGFSYSGGLISPESLSYSIAVHHAFEQLYRKFQPSYVVGADYGAELFQTLLAKAAGVYPSSRFVLFVEGSTYNSIKTYETGLPQGEASELDDPQNRLTCSMEDACLRLVDLVVYPTRQVKQQTLTKLDIQNNHDSRVIPNIVSDDFPFSRIEGLNRQLSRAVVFVGRLDTHKGADILLKSFIARYHQDYGAIPTLRFVGRDTFCKGYQSTFLSFWKTKIPDHLKSHIHFTGQVEPDQVVQYLAEATLCAFPSRWEVFGIVCLEAMAQGCPVAVSSHTGLSEVVGDGFPELKIDIYNNSDQIFALFETFTKMEQKSYEDLCLAMQNRAKDVVKSGNNNLLSLFQQESLPKAQYAQSRGKVFGELQSAFQAVADISSTLAHDFNRITQEYGISSDSLQRMLAAQSKTVIDKQESYSCHPKSLARYLRFRPFRKNK